MNLSLIRIRTSIEWYPYGETVYAIVICDKVT